MNLKHNVAKTQLRQTYFLVAGELVLQFSEDTTPTAIRLNTVVMSKDGKFALEQIARAQQALQFQWHKRSEDTSMKILDVIIIGLMNLGEFTTEEFNARPVGMDVREATPADQLRLLEPQH